jgi:hypothetical protein
MHYFSYNSQIKCFRKHVGIITYVGVTIDGVWFGEYIYSPLTGHNYKLL